MPTWQSSVEKWTPVHMVVVSQQENQSHFQSKGLKLNILSIWITEYNSQNETLNGLLLKLLKCSTVQSMQVKYFSNVNLMN